MKKWSLVWFNVAIVILAFGLTGFGLPDLSKKLAPSGGGFPGIGLITLPDPVINTLVSLVYEVKVENGRKAGKLDSNTKLTSQVERVFNDLLEAAKRSKKYGEIAKKLRWELHIIDSEKGKDLNAFAWPGGKILLYTGMLEIAENQAGLAAILGHEMIHALDRHGSKRINDNLKRIGAISSIMKNPNIKELDPKVQVAVLAGLGLGAGGTDLAFSRENEFNADEEGLLLASEAGYDPEEVSLFWENLRVKFGAGSNFEYLQTHPNNDKRVSNIKDKLPGLVEKFKNLKNKDEKKSIMLLDLS